MQRLKVEEKMAGDAWMIALVSAFFFGLALVLTQFGLRSMAAIQGAAVSIPVSTLLCWAAAPFVIDFGGWHAGAAGIFAAVGLFFPAAVTILTFEANRRMGPAVAGAVGNLAPLFAVLIAVLVLKETVTPLMAAGVGTIVAGVSMMSLGRRANGAAGWPIWVLVLPLLAALIRGTVQPAVKLGLADWNDPFAAVAIGYAVSSAAVLGVALVRTRSAAAFNRQGVAWFAAVGFCNVAAVFLLYAALARGPVTLVAPVVASYPLVTVALGWFVLRESRPGPNVLLGVGMTVAGIVFLLTGG